MTGRVVVVHNGIVENFLELKEEMSAEGIEFNSDTDTEIIAHLIERYLAMGEGLVEVGAQSAVHDQRRPRGGGAVGGRAG